MSAAQARAFLTSRAAEASRWQPVLTEIDQDPHGPLADGLSTPWRPTIASIVYEERSRSGEFLRDPKALTRVARNGTDAIRDHLLSLVVPAALHTATGRRYPPARGRGWLATVARALDHEWPAEAFDALGMRPGERLLIRGGTSSVGMAAASIARGHGVEVAATTRRPEKAGALTPTTCSSMTARHRTRHGPPGRATSWISSARARSPIRCGWSSGAGRSAWRARSAGG